MTLKGLVEGNQDEEDKNSDDDEKKLYKKTDQWKVFATTPEGP